MGSRVPSLRRKEFTLAGAHPQQAEDGRGLQGHARLGRERAVGNGYPCRDEGH